MNKKIFWLIHILSVMVISSGETILPAYLISEEIPVNTMGLIAALIFLGMFIGTLRFGKLIDQKGIKRVVYQSFIEMIIILFIIINVKSQYIIYPLEFGFGYLSSVWMISSNSIINKITEKDQKVKQFSNILVGTSIGVIMSQFTSGIIIDWFNWKSAMYIQILTIIIILCLLSTIKLANLKIESKKSENLSFVKEMIILKNERNLSLLIRIVLLMIISGTVTSQIGLIAIYIFGNSSVGTATLINYNLVITLITNLFLTNYLRRKLSTRKIINIQFFAIVIAMILISISFKFYLITMLLVISSTSMATPIIQEELIIKSSISDNKLISYVGAGSQLGRILGAASSTLLILINNNFIVIEFIIIGIIGIVLTNGIKKKNYLYNR